MTCTVYLPTGSATPVDDKTVPVILYLSGLTCTDENVCQKSGIFRILSELGGIGFISPDTSPRNSGILGESDSWDFGVGAGFYLDATTEPWSTNYNMYSYITKELPEVITSNFPSLDITRMSITGHSMGGHGALTIALKNQHMFTSVSAFAPICNPIVAFKRQYTSYLGSNEEDWKPYDASEVLLASGVSKYDSILVDMGTADSFLAGGQLLPEALQTAAERVGQHLSLRMHEGYDHGYNFVSTFVEDHVRFHAARLLP